jgi:hypothetical protein
MFFTGKNKVILLFTLLIILGFVTSVSAFKSNFQDYGVSYINYTVNGVVQPVIPIEDSGDGDGVVRLHIAGTGQTIDISNKYPTAFVYASFDILYSDGFTLQLCDQQNNINAESMVFDAQSLGDPVGRYSIYISNGNPEIYLNNVAVDTLPHQTTNPYYLKIHTNVSGDTYIDNFILGETDHTLVGAIPVNWSIQRDILTPENNGVYALSSDGNTWISKNNDYFYIDTVKNDTATKNLIIKCEATGAVVNISAVSGIHTVKEYSVNQFLSTATADGLYTVYFEDTPTVTSQFWVTSLGAVASWDKDGYTGGDSAVISYYISNGYWRSDLNTYRVRIQNAFGVEKFSYPVLSSNGSVTKVLDGLTYTPGIYYVVLESVEIAAPNTVSVMGYDETSITNTVSVSGICRNGGTGNVLPGSNVTITQGSISNTVQAEGNGHYVSGGWYAGMPMNITLTNGVLDCWEDNNVEYCDYTEWKPSMIYPTPLEAKSLVIDLSLMSYDEQGIGGIVREPPYYTPVVGALVEGVSNKTRDWNDDIGDYENITTEYRHISYTTNAAGGYVLPVTEHRWWEIHSSKPGMANSTTYSIWVESSAE